MRGMATPQQPEVARSGHTPVTPASAKERVDRLPALDGAPGPVPEDNRPGHHPDHDQDKPERPPARADEARPGKPARAVQGRRRLRPPGRVSQAAVPRGVRMPDRRHFRFVFPFPASVAAAAVGATPLTSGVELVEGRIGIRYGPWSLRTPLENVAGAEVVSPPAWDRWVGPPRLSLPEWGVVFASAPGRRARLRLHQPVGALLPGGWLRHPSLEVTVEDPEGLVQALAPAG